VTRRTASSPIAAGGYFLESQRPWVVLVFLLPFILLYEVGTRLTAYDAEIGIEWRIVAFSLIERFFETFGAGGRFVAPLAVIATLLAWHLVAGQRWRVRPAHLLGMGLESLVLAVPLVVIGSAAMRYLPLMTPGPPGMPSMLVASIGAGIYEEFLFRLIAFAALHVILADVLRLSDRWAVPAVIVISALLFSAYHYLGGESFVPRIFVFRSLAGIYFGVLMVTRGFGITAGAHAAYDILIVLLRYGMS
jgi:membrane protease YdiL (CAAX protease family)